MNESLNIDSAVIQQRRDNVFLILAGLFLGTLSMLNILGISRFIKLFSIGEVTFAVAVGVLPYPVTFLCTDLISELYGEKKLGSWSGLVSYSIFGSYSSYGWVVSYQVSKKSTLRENTLKTQQKDYRYSLN